MSMIHRFWQISFISIFIVQISLIVPRQLWAGVSLSDSGMETQSTVPVGGYTDEQQNIINTYEHQGYLQRLKNTECSNHSHFCMGKEVDTKSWENYVTLATNSLMQMLSMMGMMMSMMGTSQGVAAAQTAAQSKGLEMMCTVLPMIGQMVISTTEQFQNQAAMASMQSQNTISNAGTVGLGDQQILSLKTQRKALENRKIGVIASISMWSMTSACHFAAAANGYKVAAGNFNIGYHLVLGGLGAFLAGFYGHLLEQCEKGIKFINGVIAALDGATNCNPITDKECYCAQPETANDTQYCKVGPFGVRTADSGLAIACVNANLQQDPTCLCERTQNCVDKIFSQLPSNFQDTRPLYNEVIKPYGSFFRGRLNTASLNTAVGNSKAAMRRAMQANRPPALLLARTPNARLMASLQKEGMEAQWARALSALPMATPSGTLASMLSSGAEQINLDKSISDRLSAKGVQVAGSGHSRTITFSNGGGRRTAGGVGSGDSDDEFMKKMMEMMQKKNGAGAKVDAGDGEDPHLLQFAERATQAAQIASDEGETIFLMLSRRYRTSAWKPLGALDTLMMGEGERGPASQSNPESTSTQE